MHPYSHYYEFMSRQNDQLIKDIEKAINGEYSAVQCYAKLANLAPTQKEKNRILEIRQDEIKHLHHFTQIYVNLTGKQPMPKMTEQCPNTFKEGLEFAFVDEQQTVDFYLEISDRANDPQIKEAFRRASADEQNHAVWFLYYLSKKRH